MNFIEAHRHIAADGNTHIKSVAYLHVRRFIDANEALQDAEKSLNDGSMPSISSGRLIELIEEKEAAAQLMRAALTEHFGALPGLLDFQGKIIDLRHGAEVLDVTSYCYLYRIERADRPTAPDLHADAAIVLDDAQ